MKKYISPTLWEEPIKYVIYCRKSTSKSSWKQEQSIASQIESCINYAKRHKLEIMEKPTNFEFETEEEVLKEENDTDMVFREIYRKSKWYFIVKEQKTSKIAWVRPKRKLLMKMVRLWQIKWIMSYLPDRQARNMLEAWELIDLLDKGMVDLKYSNFDFTNNASGKMMLGIHFAISKEYSDNLSETWKRWSKVTISRWKTMWARKYGYFRNKEWFYEPHELYFKLMKEWFQMKLQKKTNSSIVKWLNENWFRYTVDGIEKELTEKSLAKKRKDPFYYGILIHGTNESDQREVNPYYKPLITEEEYNILLERSYWVISKVSYYKSVKEVNQKIYPLDSWIVFTDDGYTMSQYIWKKSTFNEVIESNNINELDNITELLKPTYIRYKCSHKDSKKLNLEVTFKDIEEVLIRKLEKVKVSEEMYNSYVEEFQKYIDKKKDIVEENRKKLQFQENRLKWIYRNLISNGLWRMLEETELTMYKQRKEELERSMKIVQWKIVKLDDEFEHEILSYDQIISFLKDVSWFYKSTTYQEKKEINRLIIQDIIVTSKNKIKINFKEWYDVLFS